MMKKLISLFLLLCLILSACVTVSAEEATVVPYMVYSNMYQDAVGQRASLQLSASVLDEATGSITWASSAAEETVWTFVLRDDLTYTGCICTDIVRQEDGTVLSENERYDDGTGALIPQEDGTMLWQDDKEDAGHDCRFVLTQQLLTSYMQDTVSGRATMRITMPVQLTDEAGHAAADEGAMSVAISWAESAEVTRTWTMSIASTDADNVYTDCTARRVTTQPDGAESVEVLYENGTGRFETDGDTMIWLSDNDQFAEPCRFTFVMVQAPTE